MVAASTLGLASKSKARVTSPREPGRLDPPFRASAGPVVALRHQQLGEEAAVGHLVLGGTVGDVGELVADRRQAVSVAVVAACSVSPRWRGRVTVLLLSVVTAAGATSEQLVVGRHRGQWPGVRRQVVQLPLVQERHGRRRLPGGQRRRGGWTGFILGLGGFAGLQGDRVRGQGPGPQRGRQTGDQVLVRDVPGHQEHLDQGPGALGVAVCLDRCGPPGVMDRVNLPAERACSSAVAPGKAPGLRIRASR